MHTCNLSQPLQLAQACFRWLNCNRMALILTSWSCTCKVNAPQRRIGKVTQRTAGDGYACVNVNVITFLINKYSVGGNTPTVLTSFWCQSSGGGGCITQPSVPLYSILSGISPISLTSPWWIYFSWFQAAQLDTPTEDPEELLKPQGPCTSQCVKVGTSPTPVIIVVIITIIIISVTVQPNVWEGANHHKARQFHRNTHKYCCCFFKDSVAAQCVFSLFAAWFKCHW